MRPALAAFAAFCLAASGLSAQEAPDPYTVSFGVDRESFDETGITALTLAARDISLGGAGAVLVEGHTDTQADADYNLALSDRRARVIRNELIARGVAPATITITPLGQEQLAVATGDGVAEAANRRVTMTLADFGAFEAPDPLRPYAFRLP